MTPAQVCVLVLAALLEGGSGAPMARPSPAATVSPLHKMIAQRQTPASTSEEPAWPQQSDQHHKEFGVRIADHEYDYYLYEYEDYAYDETTPIIEDPFVDEPRQARADSTERADDGSEPLLNGDQGFGDKETTVIEEKERAVTESSKSSSTVAPTGSVTRPASSTASTTSATESSVSTSTKSSTTTSTTTESTTRKTGDYHSDSIKVHTSSRAKLASNPDHVTDHHNLVEQETSGSALVVTFHLQDVQHPRVTKSARDPSPRGAPEFFVPPIRRKAARRRVSLTSQNRPDPSSSLGAKLAEQVRQQLARLQADEEATGRREWNNDEQQKSTSSRHQQREAESSATSSTTTETPATSSTTRKAYKHPFIPSSPTTTSEPYKHPFIPKSPTTTSEPYKHPFIPSSPTTTSEPYKHPFIPSPPTTTSKPYKHPFIPVPPETTGRPHGGPHGEPAATPSPSPSPSPSAPQARRVPDSGIQRLHLPRRKPTPAANANSSTSSPALSSATIVHEERVQEGFIVGEYGELRGGGTVRGVKYAADSSVDRSLLEAALKQFLQL